MLEKLIKITQVPIIILNFFGGIVGGIWLLVLGEWKLVLFSLIVLFFSKYVLALVYLVFAPFVLLASYFANKKMTGLMIASAFTDMFAISLINLTWVVITVSIVFQLADQGIPLIPLILGGYAIATGPFTYMASKESPDNFGTFVGVYVTQIGYILTVLLTITGLGVLVIPLLIIIALCFDIYLLKVGYLLHKLQIQTENQLSN